ncbi:carbohydrate ABC transporter permease [Bacillus suaedae]|uniref:Carbohydrate ABC transporter permease n=1 Tax=Halalkalibacter suaedae TaxID=2822140 RepID=A0A940WYK7_9BACI|nr:carbohydrate ABC transporter permease [Bacillus suaedae]MBP3950970.1 carbohydrate ABC transporter permease [Bacillus suaedae]
MSKKTGKRILWYISISTYGLLLISPLLWMISTSLKRSEDVLVLKPSLIPEIFSIQPYIDVLQIPAFRSYLANSLFVSITSMVITVILSALAGYGFARIAFKGRKLLLTGFISAQMIPSVILLIPIFYIMNQLSLIDTYSGLIATYVTFSIPFCTWIMFGFYKGIPRELEEAAYIDGANKWQAFVKVIIPLSTPGIMASAIFAFLIAWDEFLFALALTDSESKRTLPYGLYSFMNQYGVEWNNLMAASILTMLPPIILFLFFHKYFIGGRLAGAIKE